MDFVPLFMERNGQTVRLALINATKAETPFNFSIPFNPGKLQINTNEELLADVKQ
jgi:uncharacterized lipoprotein YbaY